MNFIPKEGKRSNAKSRIQRRLQQINGKRDGQAINSSIDPTSTAVPVKTIDDQEGVHGSGRDR